MLSSLEKELYDALTKAVNHLKYCGYGDSWERSCISKLLNELDALLLKVSKLV